MSCIGDHPRRYGHIRAEITQAINDLKNVSAPPDADIALSDVATLLTDAEGQLRSLEEA